MSQESVKKITVDISSPVHWQWNVEFSALIFFANKVCHIAHLVCILWIV